MVARSHRASRSALREAARLCCAWFWGKSASPPPSSRGDCRSRGAAGARTLAAGYANAGSSEVNSYRPGGARPRAPIARSRTRVCRASDGSRTEPPSYREVTEQPQTERFAADRAFASQQHKYLVSPGDSCILQAGLKAGDRGVEPRVAVLETTVLPIHQSPMHVT